MFHKQRYRLLRKQGWTADQLAQELHSMFGPTVPLSHQGPVELRGQENGPLFTVGDFQTGDILLELTSGGQKVGDIILGENGPEFVPASGQPQVVGVGTIGSGAIPGTVVSGSDDTYQVQIFESGITQDATQTVTVKQRQIDGSDIPAGTAVAVYLGADGVYWMQAPVWM